MTHAVCVRFVVNFCTTLKEGAGVAPLLWNALGFIVRLWLIVAVNVQLISVRTELIDGSATGKCELRLRVTRGALMSLLQALNTTETAQIDVSGYLHQSAWR